MSLLRRLFLLVLLAIVPILAVESTNKVYLFDDRVAATHDEAQRLAAMFDDEHARLVEGLRQLLSTWAESSTLRARDLADCQEMAERLRESYPAYLALNVTDEAGVSGARRCRWPSACPSAIVPMSASPGRPAASRSVNSSSAGTPINRPCPSRCPTATGPVSRPASSPRCSIWAGWRTISHASLCPQEPPSFSPTGRVSCSPACPRCPAQSASPCPSPIGRC